jgi:penicillin-binding protein 1A
LPDWQLEPDAEELYGAPEDGIYVDENGMPFETGRGIEYDMEGGQAADGPPDAPPQLDQDWIDSVLGRDEQPTEDEPEQPSPENSEPPPAVRSESEE